MIAQRGGTSIDGRAFPAEDEEGDTVRRLDVTLMLSRWSTWSRREECWDCTIRGKYQEHVREDSRWSTTDMIRWTKVVKVWFISSGTSGRERDGRNVSKESQTAMEREAVPGSTISSVYSRSSAWNTCASSVTQSRVCKVETTVSNRVPSSIKSFAVLPPQARQTLLAQSLDRVAHSIEA